MEMEAEDRKSVGGQMENYWRREGGKNREESGNRVKERRASGHSGPPGRNP